MGKLWFHIKNYRLLLSLRLIKRSENRSKNRLSIKIVKKSRVNLAADGKICLGKNALLTIGAAYGNIFRRPAYLSIGSGASLTVQEPFTIFDNSRIYVRKNANLT